MRLRRRAGFVVLGISVLMVLFPWRWLTLAVPSIGPAERLAMPVAGLQPSAVRSTWHAPRSGGRRHQGVDLFAPSGTEVRAAASGTVWKVGHDALGGQVVSVLGRGPTLYYYAHLDDWAEGLAVGQRVEQGALLGHVGNTGNARTTPPHLHFGVYRWGWAWATAVDPAPLLKARRTAPGR